MTIPLLLRRLIQAVDASEIPGTRGESLIQQARAARSETLRLIGEGGHSLRGAQLLEGMLGRLLADWESTAAAIDALASTETVDATAADDARTEGDTDDAGD